MEEIYEMPLGALSTNCYVVTGEDNTAVIIDPASSEEVIEFLKEKNLKAAGIILTHGHYDHFAGVSGIKEVHGCEVYAPEGDSKMFEDSDKCWAYFMPVPFKSVKPEHLYSDGDIINISGLEFKAMNTPGHTEGSSILFYKRKDGKNAIFTGDTIFNCSVGRTDGYSGSGSAQRESLKKISELKGDYILYCGHGEHTTLEYEKRFNPYLS